MNKDRAMRWIPLTEEHPEFVGAVKYTWGDIEMVTRKVLCQTRRKEIFVAYGKRQETEDGKRYWHWYTKGTDGRKMEIRSKVIAWMPLPEFYEEE